MTMTFIAPNGARVVIKNWTQFIRDFHDPSLEHDMVMVTIYNDPLIVGTK